MFYNCSSLSDFAFPPSITKIGSYAFVNTALTNINIPQSVSIIDRYAFQNCNNLITFTIPEDSDLQTIGNGVFSGCRSFKEIINNGDHFTLWNSALFDLNKTELIVLPPACNVKYFYFPETVKKIRSSSCEGIVSLEVVVIPPSITTIESEAFKSCTNLRIINIPYNTTVSQDCFENCPKLQCGLAIENDSLKYREDLVSFSKLPRKCLHSCVFTCNYNNYSRMSSYISLCAIFLVHQYRK